MNPCTFNFSWGSPSSQWASMTQGTLDSRHLRQRTQARWVHNRQSWKNQLVVFWETKKPGMVDSNPPTFCLEQKWRTTKFHLRKKCVLYFTNLKSRKGQRSMEHCASKTMINKNKVESNFAMKVTQEQDFMFEDFRLQDISYRMVQNTSNVFSFGTKKSCDYRKLGSTLWKSSKQSAKIVVFEPPPQLTYKPSQLSRHFLLECS